MPLRIWYHGTKDCDIADAISREGFQAGTWFAAALEDAIEFGGHNIFEVALAHEPVASGNWQMKVIEALPPSVIVTRVEVTIKVIEDFPERREAVLRANEGNGVVMAMEPEAAIATIG